LIAIVVVVVIVVVIDVMRHRATSGESACGPTDHDNDEKLESTASISPPQALQSSRGLAASTSIPPASSWIVVVDSDSIKRCAIAAGRRSYRGAKKGRRSAPFFFRDSEKSLS
jgi:hypothetical protein